MTREIRLVGGDEIALVDDTDYDRLSKHRWVYYIGYALAQVDGKSKRMHRLIMSPPPKMIVHHKNGNKLDNRRANLEVMTNAEHVKLHGRYPNLKEMPECDHRALVENKANFTKTLLTKMTPETHQRIKVLAARQDRTVCSVIRAAIAAYLEREANDGE